MPTSRVFDVGGMVEDSDSDFLVANLAVVIVPGGGFAPDFLFAFLAFRVDQMAGVWIHRGRGSVLVGWFRFIRGPADFSISLKGSGEADGEEAFLGVAEFDFGLGGEDDVEVDDAEGLVLVEGDV